MRSALLRASFATIALLLASGRARAQSAAPAPPQGPSAADPYDVPEAPRSLSIPELTHPDIEWTSTTSYGSVGGGGRSSSVAVERLAVETPIGPRRWFVGLAYEAAYGTPLGSPANAIVVGGNPEIYGRTVWATRTGLAFGGGLGILPPVASFEPSSTGGDVATLASSLAPWDEAFFRAHLLTFRPCIDVRDLFGHFVVQARAQLDWSFGTRTAADTGVAASSLLYLGWLAAPFLGVGLEASEHYRIDAPIPDGQRATFQLASGVRFLTSVFQPALGAFVGAGSPLAPTADTVWGVRLALTFVWRPL